MAAAEIIPFTATTTNVLIATGWDYSIIEDADRRAAAEDVARTIRICVSRSAAAMLECGNALIHAKSLIPEGSWQHWLSREFAWDHRTARYYMAAAEVFGHLVIEHESAQRFSALLELPRTAVSRIAAADEQTRQIVTEKVQSGECRSLRQVTQAIHEAQPRGNAKPKSHAPSADGMPQDGRRGNLLSLII